MAKSLSDLQLKKVGAHGDEHHTKKYATKSEVEEIRIELAKLSGLNKALVSISRELEDKSIDWSVPQDKKIANENIDFPEIPEIPEITIPSHNELQGYIESEHIDWTKQQSLTIHSKNIPKIDISNYFNEIDHNKIKNYLSNEHIDWTKQQDKKIHHRNVYMDEVKHNELEGYKFSEHIDHNQVKITTGVGLAGGGNISKSLYIHMRPATQNVLGGVKIGRGLNIDDGGRLSVNNNVHPKKYQKTINQWAKDGDNFSHAVTHNLNEQYPQVTCWNKKTNKIVYPEIEYISENKIKVYTQNKSDTIIIKVIG